MNKENINISGIQGDVIIADIKGNKNIVGKNIVVINSDQLAKIPKEYANSISTCQTLPPPV